VLVSGVPSRPAPTPGSAVELCRGKDDRCTRHNVEFTTLSGSIGCGPLCPGREQARPRASDIALPTGEPICALTILRAANDFDDEVVMILGCSLAAPDGAEQGP
jgi:hypothetical protein